MGEYYDWVNVDRKEYICPADFDRGNKLHESMWPGNMFLCALRELLANEWAGNHVFFMGDETLIPAETKNETLGIMYRQTLQTDYPGDAFGTVLDTYKNVSGLFKAAEGEVRSEIQFYLEDIKDGRQDLRNEYGIDIKKPFEGLFLRDGRDYKFTVNHTKKVCYSLGKTKIFSLKHEERDNVDPLPYLMCYGHVTDPGAWLGDIIGVADDIPTGYELLDEICVDW